MKCNICGGELPPGERICKYCGNIVNAPDEKKEEIRPRIEQKTERKAYFKPPADTRADARIYPKQRMSSGGFCVKCGRPLDGLTHKCVVCDAAEVGRRVYMRDDPKRTEAEELAKKKKQKEQHTVRNVLLAILGLIVLFTLTLLLTFGKFSDWLGIGGSNDEKTKNEQSTVEVSKSQKATADPNWEATTDKPKKSTAVPDKSEQNTQKPARTPVPMETGDPVKNRGGEYLYASNERIISIDELDKMAEADVLHIYWEIYARHGYTFGVNDEMADYFENNHKWYVPVTSDKSKVESEFNDIEKRNEKIISDFIAKKGWK